MKNFQCVRNNLPHAFPITCLWYNALLSSNSFRINVLIDIEVTGRQ